MVATTPKNSIPYPQQGDSPNEATAMANLVGQIDRRMVPRFTSDANRTSRVPSPSNGMFGYVNATGRDTFEIYRGGAWRFCHPTRTVYKTADTNRNTTTTRTADPHLSIPLQSGRTYVCDFIGFWAGDVAADAVFEWAFPSSSGVTSWYFMAGASTSTTNTNVAIGAVTITAATVSPAVGLGTTQAGVLNSYSQSRLVITTTAAGNLGINWAQAVSSAVNTTLFTGSYMTASLVA